MIVEPWPENWTRYWCAACGKGGMDHPRTDPQCLCPLFDPPRTPMLFPMTVKIHGSVEIGEGTSICGPADINGTQSHVSIGKGCDIAGFVTINCADSSKRCVGKQDAIERLPIVIEDNVFIGTGAIILGGTHIGHQARIGAGVALKKVKVMPGDVVVRPRAQPVYPQSEFS